MALAALALLCGHGAAAGGVRLGGHVSTELQAGLDGCFGDGDCRYLDLRNTNVVGLRIQATLGQKVAVLGAVDLVNHNRPEIQTLDDLAEVERIQPVSLRIEDAYVELYGVGLKRLDLRIGAQRVRWGTGDGINPTDRFNPLDLQDPTRFDRRLTTLALLATYQAGKVRFEVAAAPLFVPAALPMRELDFLEAAISTTAAGDGFDLDEYSGSGEPIELRTMDTSVALPETTLANTAVGARILWEGTTGDLGVSYFHGRDSLPQGDGEVLLTGFATDASRVDVKVPLAYPGVDVIGIEGRIGPFGDFSAWAEAAVVFPERTELMASRWQLEALQALGTLDEVPDPLPTQATQDGEVYVQAIAGGDLSFPFGLYLNLQYLRGFPTERQRADQGNFVLGTIRYTFPGGNVVLANEAALEIRDDAAVGFMVAPRLSVMFADAVDLGLGLVWLGGQESSHFDTYSSLSHLKLSASAEF